MGFLVVSGAHRAPTGLETPFEKTNGREIDSTESKVKCKGQKCKVIGRVWPINMNVYGQERMMTSFSLRRGKK